VDCWCADLCIGSIVHCGGIGINWHGMKGVKSMGIQCGVTSSKVDMLKFKQSFSGLGAFDGSNVL
jgi:hypothetical protein